jgi:hypothetical protein
LDQVYATILYYLVNKETVTESLRLLKEETDRRRAAQQQPVEDLLLAAHCSFENEYRDLITYLPVS